MVGPPDQRDEKSLLFFIKAAEDLGKRFSAPQVVSETCKIVNPMMTSSLRLMVTDGTPRDK